MRYLFILLIGGFLISCQQDGCTDPTATNYDPNADNNDGSCQYSSPTPPTTNGAGVTDNDGNSYETVIIGNQEWMAENLRTTTYANGDPIPNVTDNTQWQNLTTGAWAHYNNDGQYENPYGKLYNWYAVADPRNICPTGWHVPTDAEWITFINYLDPWASVGSSSIAGGKMKSTGTQYWLSPNTNATNESGFSGLPGGAFGGGGFGNIGYAGFWWSSTEQSPDRGYFRLLSYNNSSVVRSDGFKYNGNSCRCIKD